MSYLSDYRLYSSGNEAHPTYHIFSSLVGLASVVSRRVWLDLGYFRVYPNLYVILVGPPGTKKTTAMVVTRKLVQSIDDVPFAPEALTKEALQLELATQQRSINDLPEEFADMRNYAPLTIIVTELSNFLGRDSMNMIDFLTTIYDYDGIFQSKTKNKGNVSIENPCLSLLACTTPDWITFYLKGDIISGGFSRRCIFVYETEEGPPVPIPEVTAAQRLAFDAAVNYGRSLKSVSGPFRWDEDCKEFYKDWYVNMRSSSSIIDDTVVGYHRSKHIQALKVAMLLSLSESSRLVLELSHFKGALDLLELVEGNMVRVFEGIGRNELNAIGGKVIDLIRRSAPHRFKVRVSGSEELQEKIYDNCIQEKALRGAMWKYANGQEMDQIIDQLIKTEKITRLTAGEKVFLCLKKT